MHKRNELHIKCDVNQISGDLCMCIARARACARKLGFVAAIADCQCQWPLYLCVSAPVLCTPFQCISFFLFSISTCDSLRVSLPISDVCQFANEASI